MSGPSAGSESSAAPIDRAEVHDEHDHASRSDIAAHPRSIRTLQDASTCSNAASTQASRSSNRSSDALHETLAQPLTRAAETPSKPSSQTTFATAASTRARWRPPSGERAAAPGLGKPCDATGTPDRAPEQRGRRGRVNRPFVASPAKEAVVGPPRWRPHNPSYTKDKARTVLRRSTKMSPIPP